MFNALRGAVSFTCNEWVNLPAGERAACIAAGSAIADALTVELLHGRADVGALARVLAVWNCGEVV